QDAARSGPQNTGQAIEERAFSRPVRPDDCADLTTADLEVDIVECGEAAEADCQKLGPEKRSGSSLPSGRGPRVDRCIRGHVGHVPVMLTGICSPGRGRPCPGHPDYSTSLCRSKRPKSTLRRGELAGRRE